MNQARTFRFFDNEKNQGPIHRHVPETNPGSRWKFSLLIHLHFCLAMNCLPWRLLILSRLGLGKPLNALPIGLGRPRKDKPEQEQTSKWNYSRSYCKSNSVYVCIVDRLIPAFSFLGLNIRQNPWIRKLAEERVSSSHHGFFISYSTLLTDSPNPTYLLA